MDRFRMIITVHMFFVQNDEVLLLRRANTCYEDGNYSVPAGHVDGGEAVTTAAIREAGEECGVRIAHEDLQVVGVMHRLSDDERIDFFLRPTRWTGAIVNAEPQKCDDLSWYSLKHLPDNVIPYVNHALTNYQQGTWFMEYGWN